MHGGWVLFPKGPPARKGSHFRNHTAMTSRIPLHSERGQTMAEYAVALTAITLAVIGALGLLTGRVGTVITNVAQLIR
jgi:Flp pilus assembly pilin Flp